MGGRDLGTYWLRVEFENGDGYFYKYETGACYTNGANSCSPLTAFRIPPTWENEEDMISTIEFSWNEGNYSCDCNRVNIFLQEAHQRDPINDDSGICSGVTLRLKRLTLIAPDNREIELHVDDYQV